MIKKLLFIFLFLAIVALLVWYFNRGKRVQPIVESELIIPLQSRIINIPKDTFLVKNQVLSSPELLTAYYNSNSYTPIWIGKDGLLPIADSLLTQIKESVFEGLNPANYHLQAIEMLKKEIEKKGIDSSTLGKCTDIELLLSDAFFTYASHQYAGSIHTKKYNLKWKENVASLNLVDSLQKVLEQKDIRNMLGNFSCVHSQYKSLKKILKKYLTIDKMGGWMVLSDAALLKSGDKNVQVLYLRKRLLVVGELSESPAVNDSLYDSFVTDAIKEFQRTHGLKENGNVDPPTLVELNVPIEKRIAQIRLNMERWRWMPIVKVEHILVNLAGFRMDVIENNETVLDMKIIAGTSTNSTPIFNARMTYLILNPWWEIPLSIARKEMLPEMKKDSTYFSRKNIKMYTSWKPGAPELSINNIDWQSLQAENFSYRLRQMPGSWNALGQIKFMFPNKYSIYLHDTPNRNLFSKTVRTFSHGCIRIEQPIELASYLLRNDTAWTKEKIIQAIELKEEKIISVDPITVYVAYFTVYSDKVGSVYFNRDIYKYNRELEKWFVFKY